MQLISTPAHPCASPITVEATCPSQMFPCAKPQRRVLACLEFITLWRVHPQIGLQIPNDNIWYDTRHLPLRHPPSVQPHPFGLPDFVDRWGYSVLKGRWKMTPGFRLRLTFVIVGVLRR